MRISGVLAAAILALSASTARAQLFDSSQFFGSGLGSDTLQGAAPYGNPVADNRVYIHGFFDQLEGRIGDGTYFRWDGQAWIGDDYNKLWLKSEGRYNPGNRGRMEDGDHEALYDRPISRYFDVQGGVRVDLDSNRTRTWAALGIQGLAIGFWNVEATAYASDNGHYAARLKASYDLLLTNRWILQPEAELNFYTKSDPGRRTGSGLSDIDAGLRLRYELSRKFAPYVGVSYSGLFGQSATFARREGESPHQVRFTFGVRTWF